MRKQKFDFNAPITRLCIAIFGTLLARFPFFSFQAAVAHLQKKTIWENQFEVACISDCRVYGELAVGFDRTGTFTWTYFPIWPKLIRFCKALLPQMDGYSATVILSWVVGILAGSLCLLFFDRYWKNDSKVLGFSRKAWTLLFILSIYPHGHFWFQGYSEPLFVSVLLLGLLAASSKHWILAGGMIGLSAIVRPQGLWLPPIWGALLSFQAYQKKISWQSAVCASAVSALGICGLLYWYWHGTGDIFYYYKIQAQGGYGRAFSLWDGIWNHRPRWDSAVLYLYLSLIGSIRLLKRPDFLSRLLGGFSLAFTEIPLFFGGFYSYVRFLSVSFALFVLLTEEAEQSRWKEKLIFVFFLTKLAVQVYKSGFHEWVG